MFRNRRFYATKVSCIGRADNTLFSGFSLLFKYLFFGMEPSADLPYLCPVQMTKIRKQMKTNKLMMPVAAALLLLAGVACGNRSPKAGAAAAEQTAAAALQIDDLLAGADSLAGKEVWIEGVCTHACKHGARKIFLMGSDDTQMIRVESGKLGKFDPQCVGSIVRVKGILQEQRVDEAYLQRWEQQVRAQMAEQHGTTEAGCDSEKKARGETATTVDGRIADFRQKIAQRNAAEGKPYLSFYFVEAQSYEFDR